ncbi:MAG TPA: hypothetical protein VLJ37_08470 [bacterium]|nr:hypothetical protein [bacterium]
MKKTLSVINLLVLLALLLVSVAARAKDKHQEEIPDALDYDRRKAVSRRFELSPYGGDFLGEKLNHSFVVGGNLQFNFTNTLGIAGDFAWSPSNPDRSSAFGATVANDNVYMMDGAFVVTMPSVFRSGKSMIEADLFTSLGAGVVRFDGSNRIGGFVGGGMKIRPNISWLAFRVEIRNYFAAVDNPVGGDFEYILNFRLGPTFLLPPDL